MRYLHLRFEKLFFGVYVRPAWYDFLILFVREMGWSHAARSIFALLKSNALRIEFSGKISVSCIIFMFTLIKLDLVLCSNAFATGANQCTLYLITVPRFCSYKVGAHKSQWFYSENQNKKYMLPTKPFNFFSTKFVVEFLKISYVRVISFLRKRFYLFALKLL